MIKRYTILVTVLIFCGISQIYATPQESIELLPKHRFSTVLITRLIDQYHYQKSPLNDAFSEEIFEEYLKTLDPNRNLFTQQDIDQFSRYKLKLDNALVKGDLEPAIVIFKKFNQRRIERADYALNRLASGFDFSIDEEYLFNREDSAWPKDKAALDEIWRKRIKNDYLTLQLEGKKDEQIRETLQKRYKRFKKRSTQFKPEDVYEYFINAYLRTIEPHTAYFSPRTSENFNINMSLSLEGIGAALQTVDEYTVIKRIIKGGPADLSRQLHVGDKIIGVGQGTDTVHDVIGWRLDDVVEKIRGPKDSTVQLHILPEDSGLGGSGKYVTIVRNKIKLEDQQVKKSIIEIPDGSKIKKIGVIEIPTFYLDFAALARKEKDYKSTTRDTRKIIEELLAENIDGIIIDLRKNGGGSLVEAIALTGLFIKSGPVVQIRNSANKIKIDEDKDDSIAYSGPLAVLVDRHSASASEIFSGAIQDYGRGTIVGEPTFGKGTVQTIIDLNDYVKGDKLKLGKLKITMAQFFRVNGDSTQNRGVVPDIIYPTSIKDDKQGESSLAHALPWAQVPAAAFIPSNKTPDNLNEIKQRHEERLLTDTGFNYLISQSHLRQELIEKKALTLFESNRKNDREQRKKDQNEKLNKFRLSRGIKAVPVSEDVVKESDENKVLSDEIHQILLRETAKILVDLIQANEKDNISQHNMAKSQDDQS